MSLRRVRQRTEVHTFSREEVEDMAKGIAKARIIGPIFYGTFVKQEAQTEPDGRVRVFTTLEEEDR